MANISINLSSAVISELNGSTQADTIGDDLSLFFQADYAFSASHPYYASYSQLGTQLRLNYADGAYTSYTGVALAAPNAISGAATVTNIEQVWPSYYRLTASGLLNFHYDASSGNPQIQGQGGSVTAAAIQTLLPSYSPDYDATLGNVIINMQGNLNLSANGGISGVVTSLNMSAERTLLSSSLTGNFTVSGNATSIAQNLSSLVVSGTATSYTEKYADGSSVSLTNIAIPVTGDTTIDTVLLADGANLPGDDVINVTLGAVADHPWRIASGAGNDQVSITGAGSSLSVDAGAGNDTITLGDSNHSIDGGAGTDSVVFSGAHAAYSVTRAGAGYTVQSNAGADTLSNVERLQFSDSMMALDISGNGGQVYRLYQAAFNRTPDAGGLGYWIKIMDSGATLQSIAAEFIKSDESKAMYGANPDNADFLDKLYHNVLHRAGDAAGYDWWLGHLNAGDISQAQALAEFGESAENQAALTGVIGNGFTYTPYG